MAKATKNKKSKEGRHVGLDFYDLLIEALKMPRTDAAEHFYPSPRSSVWTEARPIQAKMKMATPPIQPPKLNDPEK